MNGEIDQELFDQWLDHPVTKALHATLRRWNEERVTEWKSGNLLGEGQFATALVNARAIAECQVCDTILELDLEGILEGKEK